jgi:hypothetical protein
MEQTMSTDALREALEAFDALHVEALSEYRDWVGIPRGEYERLRLAVAALAREASETGHIPDYSPGDVIAAYEDGTIVLDDGLTTWNPERAKKFLRKVCSETEKLPAKWRRLGENVNSLVSYYAVAAELEAALKVDRVGAPTSTK